MADSALRTTDFSGMLQLAQAGDYLFFWNHKPLSCMIEELTHGPSHVIQLARITEDTQWYEFEAVFPQGVRLLPLSHYAGSKNRMLLCRRKGATATDVAKATASGFRVLGREYNYPEELRIVLHDVLRCVPIGATQNTLYCSGLVQLNYAETSVPFAAMPQENDTPEFLLNDAGTERVCWVNA